MDERLGKLLGCLEEKASRGHYIYRGKAGITTKSVRDCIGNIKEMVY